MGLLAKVFRENMCLATKAPGQDSHLHLITDCGEDKNCVS